jgi:folate-binding protein YgfZ
LEAGIPLWGIDMDDRVLPPEMGPHFEAEHISYAKGCYTGQEILMRMHSRGHANRTWVGLVAVAPVDAGSRVVYEGGDSGIVTSVAPSPMLGFIAAAMLRKEATKPGEMVSVITPSATVRAEVRPMPLLPPR